MKKILIFTSRGGRGHISATQAISQEFSKQYHIEPYFVFSDLLRTFDLTTFFTFGKLTGEDVYNWLLQNKFFSLINLYYWCGKLYFNARRNTLKKKFITFLSTKKPDLIISVVPLINGALCDAAEDLGIPFVVIPTDLDSSSFICGIENPTYAKFRYCIPFNDSNIKKTVEPANINTTRVKSIGFPIRSAFFEAKDCEELKKRYHVPPDKPVLLLMLGGIGSNELVTFVRKLSAITLPLHLLVCLGKSKHLKQTIQEIQLPKNITITIIEFTDRISDLMAISTAIITKSGSVSLSESLYMDLPILLDATTSVITWERFNHYFIQKHHAGLIINNHAEIPFVVTRLLNNPLLLKEIKTNIQRIEKRRAVQELEPIFKELLNT